MTTLDIRAFTVYPLFTHDVYSASFTLTSYG